MRKRAAKTLGIPAQTVSTAQIAQAFLDHACERKAGLRQAFATFFANEADGLSAVFFGVAVLTLLLLPLIFLVPAAVGGPPLPADGGTRGHGDKVRAERVSTGV